MAKISLQLLKSKFENGDTPSQNDFEDLIDTLRNDLLTTEDVPDSVNRRYVTDSELNSISSISTLLYDKENKNDKNIGGGYAGLDSSGKLFLDQLPLSFKSNLNYHGLYDCSTGITPVTINSIKGDYWVCSVEGTINTVHYAINDWLVYNGASLDKIDNQGITIDTDTGLGGQNSSDVKVASQKAIKYYVDNHSSPYSLPAATTNTLGGLKIGNGVSIDNSTKIISISGATISNISTNTTLLVGTGRQFSTVQAAYDSLKNKWINQDVVVTISVAPEHITSSSIILPSHPCSSRIIISGEGQFSTNITKIVSITNINTNLYNVTVNIADTSNILVNDYIFITNDTKTGTNSIDNSCNAYTGVWKINTVNNDNIIFTYYCANDSIPPTANVDLNTSNFPNAYIIKSIINFTGTHGIQLNNNCKLKSINNLVLVGDRTLSTYGLNLIGSNKLELGNLFGISNFNIGLYGENTSLYSSGYFSSNSNTSHGILLKRSNCNLGNDVSCIGNLNWGIKIYASSCIFTGKSSRNGSGIFFFYSTGSSNGITWGNVTWGIGADGSNVDAQTANTRYNGNGSIGNGFGVQSGGFINLKGATVSNNGTASPLNWGASYSLNGTYVARNTNYSGSSLFAY